MTGDWGLWDRGLGPMGWGHKNDVINMETRLGSERGSDLSGDLRVCRFFQRYSVRDISLACYLWECSLGH